MTSHYHLTIAQIQTRLLLRRQTVKEKPFHHKAIPSAVLLILYPGPTGLNLVMLQRASHLRAHPGQIAFPGGKQDPHDKNLWETAIRETEEELGIPAGKIRQLGVLPRHYTTTGYSITPYVGFISSKPKLRINHSEVDKALIFELSELLNPHHHHSSRHTIKGQMRRLHWIAHNEQLIWGASAAILITLRELLA